MKKYRIIIAGGRDFSDYVRFKDHVDNCIKGVLRECAEEKNIIILSGKANGADSLGERYATERGYKVVGYPADWKKNGRAAGPIRNKQMAENADALIAFWDGCSHGTKNMIETAQRMQLHVFPICYYRNC